MGAKITPFRRQCKLSVRGQLWGRSARHGVLWRKCLRSQWLQPGSRWTACQAITQEVPGFIGFLKTLSEIGDGRSGARERREENSGIDARGERPITAMSLAPMRNFISPRL
jgi:hypothetical protein